MKYNRKPDPAVLVQDISDKSTRADLKDISVSG